MSEWTSEAEEYLKGYLHQLGALARHQGDDAEEIVSELRAHITQEVEGDAGALVTVEHLRRTLAAVGTPEEIVAGETPVAGASLAGASASVLGEDTGGSGPVLQTPRRVVSPPDAASSASSGCRILAITLAFITVGLVVFVVGGLVWLGCFQYRQIQQASIIAHEKSAVKLLKDIANAQREFRQTKHDPDQDGITDYGDLMKLVEAGLLPDMYVNSTPMGYVYSCSVVLSSEKDGPAFRATAMPANPIPNGPRIYHIDQTGNIWVEPSTAVPPAAVEVEVVQPVSATDGVKQPSRSPSDADEAQYIP